MAFAVLKAKGLVRVTYCRLYQTVNKKSTVPKVVQIPTEGFKPIPEELKLRPLQEKNVKTSTVSLSLSEYLLTRLCRINYYPLYLNNVTNTNRLIVIVYKWMYYSLYSYFLYGPVHK